MCLGRSDWEGLILTVAVELAMRDLQEIKFVGSRLANVVVCTNDIVLCTN